MSEQNSESNKLDIISIIYHQRNDSPKHFEIKRSKIYLFIIGLPTLTLIALVIGIIGLVNTGTLYLMPKYKINSKKASELSRQANLVEEVNDLKSEIAALNEQIQSKKISANANDTQPPSAAAAPSQLGTAANLMGLSTTSLFKPVQGQKDRTRYAALNLSGFKAEIGRDNVNLKFNIIPNVTDDSKISGHIIILMKNELGIQAYPASALSGNDFQINYSVGEQFTTQRFRPVEAAFVKPRKSGNFSFTVFIFSLTGDLLHIQSVNIPLKL